MTEPTQAAQPNDTLANIALWHQRARPTPDNKAFQVQLGCHFEEVAEMLGTLASINNQGDALIYAAYHAMNNLALALKTGAAEANVLNRNDILDAIADQIVTGVGVAHCLGMNSVEATKRVDTSNWSKFVDGFPVFNENGKIAKPATYQAPDLGGCY